MKPGGGSCILIVLIVLILALPRASAAQSEPHSLRLPTIAFGATALSDWASTYHALKHFQVREQNPLLRSLDDRPARMVGLGAAIDIGLAAGWNYSVGREHPRVAAAGLWAASAFRAFLAYHNLHNERRSLKR